MVVFYYKVWKMSLSISNELGKIKLDPVVIAGIVYECTDAPDVRGNLWIASGKRHITGIIPVIKDLDKSIRFGYDNDKLSIELNVVIKFGISISNATKVFSDRIEEKIKEMLGLKTESITINISGVKSKQVAKRRTRVVYRYES